MTNRYLIIVKSSVFLPLVCLFLYAPASYAEMIYMKDGRIFKEKIAYRSRGVVWIQGHGGNIGLNIKDIEKILDSGGAVSKYDYAAIVVLMQDAVKRADYLEAEHLCGILLEAIPDNVQLRYLRGMLNQKMGNVGKTRQDYNYLVSNNMADANILNNLGVVYATDKQYKEAEDLFIKVLEREPDNTNALFNLGVLYMNEGDYAKAKELMSKVLAMSLQDEDARKALESLKKREELHET